MSLPKALFTKKKKDLLPIHIWQFQSGDVFLSTVPTQLAFVFCTQNISLDYLYSQVWKHKPERRTRADSRKVASPGGEWDLHVKRHWHRITKAAFGWGTCTQPEWPQAVPGMWQQRPQIAVTSPSPSSGLTASVQTAWDRVLHLHERKDDEWDSGIKSTKHVNSLRTEIRLVIVTLSPVSTLVNTSQGFCYYVWTWVPGGLSLHRPKTKKAIRMCPSTFFPFIGKQKHVHPGSPWISRRSRTCAGNNSWQGSDFVPLAFESWYSIPCAGMQDWISKHGFKENKKCGAD